MILIFLKYIVSHIMLQFALTSTVLPQGAVYKYSMAICNKIDVKASA